MIPKLPPFYNMIYTNEKGYLTNEALFFNDQMWQSLNSIVDNANDGWRLPLKTQTEIDNYRDNTAVPIGTLWFNTDTGYVNVKTVQAIASPPTPGTVRVLDYL